MKRYIKSVSNPIKDKYLRELFDEAWEVGDRNKDSFIDDIEEEWYTGQAETGLQQFCRDEDIELDELLDLAAQYVEYRESGGTRK